MRKFFFDKFGHRGRLAIIADDKKVRSSGTSPHTFSAKEDSGKLFLVRNPAYSVNTRACPLVVLYFFRTPHSPVQARKVLMVLRAISFGVGASASCKE